VGGAEPKKDGPAKHRCSIEERCAQSALGAKTGGTTNPGVAQRVCRPQRDRRSPTGRWMPPLGCKQLRVRGDRAVTVGRQPQSDGLGTSWRRRKIRGPIATAKTKREPNTAGDVGLGPAQGRHHRPQTHPVLRSVAPSPARLIITKRHLHGSPRRQKSFLRQHLSTEHCHFPLADNPTGSLGDSPTLKIRNSRCRIDPPCGRSFSFHLCSGPSSVFRPAETRPSGPPRMAVAWVAGPLPSSTVLGPAHEMT